MASLTDNNEAGGNLDKRNIWLIGLVILVIRIENERIFLKSYFSYEEI